MKRRLAGVEPKLPATWAEHESQSPFRFVIWLVKGILSCFNAVLRESNFFKASYGVPILSKLICEGDPALLNFF